MLKKNSNLVTIKFLVSIMIFKNYNLNNIKMDNEEILNRIKKHNLFFDSLKDQIEDKIILNKAKRYMELLFFELIKNNINKDNDMKSKL
tara:strand:+ start:387 stop:653 length:267 start_codon:yes stop_codon:yes gene_type:complete